MLTPLKQIIRLIGNVDDLPLSELILTKIASSTKHKPRKDAVLCSEIFLSASPEYFRPHNPQLHGEWDDSLMWNFANTSKTWLHDRFNEEGMLRATRAYVQTIATKIVTEEPTPQFVPPLEDESKWQAVQNYLTKTRGLPENFIDALHTKGWIYADDQQNAVFVMRLPPALRSAQSSPQNKRYLRLLQFCAITYYRNCQQTGRKGYFIYTFTVLSYKCQ